jgi:predicted secreted acid phosphatase
MKTKFLIKSVVLINIVFCFSTSFAQEPTPNLSLYKNQLIKYYDSGEYAQDMNAVAQQAIAYLTQRVQQNNTAAQPKKLAVVFDIDETSLSNFNYMRAADFAFPFKILAEEQPQANEPVLPSTLKLYQEAIKDHVAVFFITGRKENLRAATIFNLHKVGYSTWDALILKPENFQADSAALFKAPLEVFECHWLYGLLCRNLVLVR